MSTPGYDSQVVGRDCSCEDFPCCGHGITQADLDSHYQDYEDWRAEAAELEDRDEWLDEEEEEEEVGE